MGKKLKTVLKVSSVAMLCAAMLSSEALAAENNAVAHESLSNYRCRNSTCGAYLVKASGWGTICDTCGQVTHSYECNICKWRYQICPDGHYCQIY